MLTYNVVNCQEKRDTEDIKVGHEKNRGNQPCMSE